MLVAISIPIFTSQLEKSREATDLANIRSAYAVIQSAALVQDDQATLSKSDTDITTYTVEGSEGSFVYTAVVKLKQKQEDWQTSDGAKSVAGLTITGTPASGGNCTITYTQSTNKTTAACGAGT